jgi:Transglycosylase-like domain
VLRFEPATVACATSPEPETTGAPDRRAAKDVIMRPTTTTALALAGTAMALPAGVALAESTDDPPSPAESALAAPLAGHLTVTAQMRAERRELLVRRLAPRVIRAERTIARIEGVDFSRRAQERRLRGESPSELRSELRNTRRELRRARAGAGTATAAAPPHLQAIAACESGGDPSAIGGGGAYRGKYQFDMGTWASVGGTGDPAAASEAEQDARAAQLYAQQGTSPWPVCG